VFSCWDNLRFRGEIVFLTLIYVHFHCYFVFGYLYLIFLIFLFVPFVVLLKIVITLGLPFLFEALVPALISSGSSC